MPRNAAGIWIQLEVWNSSLLMEALGHFGIGGPLLDVFTTSFYPNL